MIIMGGTFPDSTMCDAPNVYGLHNANLGENNPDGAHWSLFTLNFPPYNVPQTITNVTGGT
jgi:hypothetical protein